VEALERRGRWRRPEAVFRGGGGQGGPAAEPGTVCGALAQKGSTTALNRGAASLFGANAPSKPVVVRPLPW
jgi:hypothetical protein